MTLAKVELKVTIGTQAMAWNWEGDETEWKSSILAYIGNPIQQTNAAKATTALGKIVHGIGSFVERATRPNPEYVKRKHEAKNQ